MFIPTILNHVCSIFLSIFKSCLFPPCKINKKKDKPTFLLGCLAWVGFLAPTERLGQGYSRDRTEREPSLELWALREIDICGIRRLI